MITKTVLAQEAALKGATQANLEGKEIPHHRRRDRVDAG